MTEPVPLSRLTVVIPNWGTVDYTIRCARALMDDGVPPDRIVVVENGSKDDSYDRLLEALPECGLLRLEQNKGYAPGANRGAQELEGDAYLVINNDAFVHLPGSVQRMLRELARPEIGLVVPRLLNEDETLQPSVRPLDDAASTFVRAIGVSRFVPNRWQPRLGTRWDHATSRFVRAADGPVMLVRGDVWHELGGFIEGRVMHGEDSDLCWRIRRRGLGVWFEREAAFIHLWNASGRRHFANPERGELIGRAEGAMLREHLPLITGALALAFTGMGLAGRWLVFGVMRQRERSKVQRFTLRGYLAGFKMGQPPRDELESASR